MLGKPLMRSAAEFSMANTLKAVLCRAAAIAAMSLLLLQASTAFAQKVASGETLQESDIPDIIVTARKTAERLQDAPMSVAVITADLIEKTGATTLEDLGRATPGMAIVSAAPGQNQIILRGLSGNNTAGFYLDDTPLSIGIGNAVQPTNYDMDPALFDLDRVEVLRRWFLRRNRTIHHESAQSHGNACVGKAHHVRYGTRRLQRGGRWAHQPTNHSRLRGSSRHGV